VGADITLVTIHRDAHAQERAVIQNIVNADLSTRRGRIKNVVRMIRLVKLLRTLEATVPKGVDVDMLPLPR
jgi:hypothetical protein